ncbi:MAG: hypothetical protein JW875_07085 [Spirochaetales bacterium]|nr:hypothetical protein [Spirochaetales bacterium]
MTRRHSTFFFFVFFLVVVSSCTTRYSRVPCTGAPHDKLIALTDAARDGVLPGPSSRAWFSFGDSALESAQERAIEVMVSAEGSEPVSISLAPVFASDVQHNGSLASVLSGRHISRLEGLSGTIKLSMIPFDDKQRIAGFAVERAGGGDTQVTITSVSVRQARTGWDVREGERWVGFGPEGGSARLGSLPESFPLEVPSHATMELVISPVPPSDAGIPTKPTRFSLVSRDTAFGFRSSPVPHIALVSGSLPQVSSGVLSFEPANPPVQAVRVSWYTPLSGKDPSNPFSPLLADPHTMLQWPQAAWRDSAREVFAWDRFPGIVIFDTANYLIQDLYFKRLAFFVEKAGYRGTLVSDSDMQGKHGFNAHDYRAESLAQFFDKARRENFQLNREELELRDILLTEGIIQHGSDGYTEGSGAVLSLSRQSAEYLRYLFMTHECFHGLYFTDPDFRSQVSQIYHATDERARIFLQTYFSLMDSLSYDLDDEYLMENEFMAYLLQQPVDKVGDYFTAVISERFLRYGGDREQADYIKESGARDFIEAATELEAYVFRRWGLAAGRAGLWFSK